MHIISVTVQGFYLYYLYVYSFINNNSIKLISVECNGTIRKVYGAIN